MKIDGGKVAIENSNDAEFLISFFFLCLCLCFLLLGDIMCKTVFSYLIQTLCSRKYV